MATTTILRNKYIHFTAILCSALIYSYLAYLSTEIKLPYF